MLPCTHMSHSAWRTSPCHWSADTSDVTRPTNPGRPFDLRGRAPLCPLRRRRPAGGRASPRAYVGLESFHIHPWLRSCMLGYKQRRAIDDLEMYICNARHRWMHGRIRSIGTAGHMSVGRIRSCDYEHDVLPNGRPDSKRSEECQHRCHGPWIDDGRGAPLYMPAGGTMWSTSGNRHCNCFFWVTFCVVWTAWRTKLQRNKLSLDGALSWNHYPCPLFFFFLGSKSLKLISFGYIYITSPGRRREEVFPCILFIRVKSTIDP
jgi:hypothetical protein